MKKKKEETQKTPEEIIRFPLSTEKSIRLMESENKLIFVVDKNSNKSQIKTAIQNLFKVKVKKVTTMISSKGEKRAFVKFSQETPAIDIATKLGMM